MERIATILSSETATVIKTSAPVQTWTKPQLVKLGELKDVAGNNAINNDGPNNGKNPLPS